MSQCRLTGPVPMHLTKDFNEPHARAWRRKILPIVSADGKNVRPEWGVQNRVDDEWNTGTPFSTRLDESEVQMGNVRNASCAHEQNPATGKATCLAGTN